ncbi:hypothetical protein Tco_0101278 [Tanacetum coccineum]
MPSSNIPAYSSDKSIEFLIPLVNLFDTDTEMIVVPADIQIVIPEIALEVEAIVVASLAGVLDLTDHIDSEPTHFVIPEATALVAPVRHHRLVEACRWVSLETVLTLGDTKRDAEFRLKQCEPGWIQDSARLRRLEEHLGI